MNDRKISVAIAIAGVFVVGLWLSHPRIAAWQASRAGIDSRAGDLGDSFGGLSALFSGLALLGVIGAIGLQTREIRHAIETSGDQIAILRADLSIDTVFRSLDLYLGSRDVGALADYWRVVQENFESVTVGMPGNRICEAFARANGHVVELRARRDLSVLSLLLTQLTRVPPSEREHAARQAISVLPREDVSILYHASLCTPGSLPEPLARVCVVLREHSPIASLIHENEKLEGC
jgi:hypothetical protein